MARKLRFVPEGGALVEVTCRTVQGRFLLRPSPQLNEIILGVLGRAQREHPVEIIAYVFLSNHFHLLLWVHDAQRLSTFMEYFNGNLARELARSTGWKDKIWARRYQAIIVSEEEAAQALASFISFRMERRSTWCQMSSIGREPIAPRLC